MKPDDAGASQVAEREVNRGLVYVLLLLNAAVMVGICGMILSLILSACGLGPKVVDLAARLPHPAWLEINADVALPFVAGRGLAILMALMLIPTAAKISHHSVWSHPHFSAATLAQFFYVAAKPAFSTS